MAEHFAEVSWTANTHPERPDTYSRDHTVTLENGHTLLASAAPAYLGNPQAANPETLLLAALSSCHMLTFLAVAAKRGYPVASYADKATGILGKNAEGRMAITHCVLRPQIDFIDGNSPSAEDLARFHDSAHRNCFIANSLNTEVRIET
jgi:organic hydroperoxide reductase OsmC/OhrA